MARQLASDTKKVLHESLNNKIEKYTDKIRKIQFEWTENEETKEIVWGEKKEKLSSSEEKEVDNHWDVIKNCQLSLRIVHNTGWIPEWRAEHIRVEKIKEAEMPAKIQAAEEALTVAIETTEAEAIKEAEKHLDSVKQELENIQYKIKLLTRASKCNRKDCYGRGFCGFNVTTGEYSFCACTLKTIHYYNVEKVSD